MGEEGGRDWEGDARQTCRASYWVRLQITRGGPLQGGEEGVRVVSHLHSPIKFLYFSKKKNNKKHETEQSEKSQSGDTWYNKEQRL